MQSISIALSALISFNLFFCFYCPLGTVFSERNECLLPVCHGPHSVHVNCIDNETLHSNQLVIRDSIAFDVSILIFHGLNNFDCHGYPKLVSQLCV